MSDHVAEIIKLLKVGDSITIAMINISDSVTAVRACMADSFTTADGMKFKITDRIEDLTIERVV